MSVSTPAKSIKKGGYIGLVSKENILTLENMAADNAVAKLLQRSVINNASEAISRDVLPKEDLGFANETWTVDLSSGTVNDWNDVVAGKQVGDKKAIVFWGIKVIDQGGVEFIEFATGSGGNIYKDRIDVSKYDPQTGILPLKTIIGYGPKSYMWIRYYISSTGTPKIVLLGKTAEPEGELLSA